MEYKQTFPETPKEINQWLWWYFGKEAKSLDRLEREIKQHGEILTAYEGDCWSAYLIGDTVKIVCIKTLKRRKLPKDTLPLAKDKKRSEGQKNANEGDANHDGERMRQSLSRTRGRIFELAMCNEFRFFGTFTLDEKMRDRFDLKSFRKDFAQYVRNLNRERDEEHKIKYLMIPEQHKDGAWHMHGLLQGLSEDDFRAFDLSENIPEKIKEQIREGKAVYDWTGYRSRFGYFTATEVENKTAVSKYITKYVTKELKGQARETGEHLFFASQGLRGKSTLAHHRKGRVPIEAWGFENDYVKIAEIPLDELSEELITAINDRE